MQALLLALIRFYKRFISPHKGFACAYRVHTGRASCSTLGYRAIRRHGAFAGLGLLNRRGYLCGVAQRRYAPVHRPLAAQRGDCDPGCSGCDVPDLNCDLPGTSLCDFADCCQLVDCCDWPDRRHKRRKAQEKYVYIPPKVSPRNIRPRHRPQTPEDKERDKADR